MINSKYKPYPKYKTSGVEWLGRIPSSWNMDKLRYCFTFDKGLTITKANLADSGVPCVNYGEVHSKYGFEVDPAINHLRYVSELYLQSSPNSLLAKGDFIFADTSEDIEGSGNFTQLVSDQSTFAGYHTVIVRPKKRNNNRFLAYIFDSIEYRTQIRYMVKGVKVFSITQAILRNTSIWLPSLPEQRTIAAFLDYETGKIDELIEKQQNLIALLEEKRQAVISQAVTKGLNPNVTMKDSGVEWLGKIPAHWEVKKLRRITTLQQGLQIAQSSRYHEGTKNRIEYITIKSINAGTERLNKEYIESPSQRVVCFESDILLARTGATGQVVTNISGVFHNNFFKVNYDSHQVNRDYLVNFLKVEQVKNHLLMLAGTTTIPDLNHGAFLSTCLCLPSLQEQCHITDYLAKQIAKFDNLTSKAKSAIELMKERRTALISAAVTGKIDVRDFEGHKSS